MSIVSMPATRRAQPLEAVVHLERLAPLERAHPRELPARGERPAPRRRGRGVGQTQPPEAVPELGPRNMALGVGGYGHGGEA